jgi:hypothetical protein
VDNGSWSWGNIGYVATGTAGDFDPTNASDAIVDLVYALGARYRANASFVMNSKTAGAVRKMKDADGRFLWSDGLSQGQPARLMGYPVLIAEDMPDIATDQMAIAFGDFGAGYTIAERPDLRVLRDPFSAKPHVLFYATKRVGGDVTDFAAIKLMKFGMVLKPAEPDPDPALVAGAGCFVQTCSIGQRRWFGVATSTSPKSPSLPPGPVHGQARCQSCFANRPGGAPMLVEMTPVPGADLPLAALAEHMRLSRGFTDDADLDAEIESALRAALAAIEARTGKAVFRRRFVQTVT